MGRITDLTAVQFRMLNRSKGAAMWSPRAQCDKSRFSAEWRRTLENTPNLYLWQDTAVELLFGQRPAEEGRPQVRGIRTQMGVEFSADCVILTAGTFLAGVMYCGRSHAEGGRAGDSASHGVTESLVAMGFEAGRMKTGTLHDSMRGRSISKFWNRNTGMKIPRNFPFPPIRIRCRISFRAFGLYFEEGA